MSDLSEQLAALAAQNSKNYGGRSNGAKGKKNSHYQGQKKKSANSSRSPQNNGSNGANRSAHTAREYDGPMATAPYNFVSLPTSILPAPIDAVANWQELRGDRDREQERFDKFREYIVENGKYTGELALTLECVTPLYIGAGNGKFFAPLGTPVIPGSTLRGLTKNLVKIVTCGAMRPDEDFTELNLYYRSIAGRDKKLRAHYQECMLEEIEVGKGDKKEKINVSKAKGGFLVRQAGHYYMCPADLVLKKIPEGQYKSSRYNTAKINWDEKRVSAEIITARAIQEKKHYIVIEKADFERSHWLEVPEQVIKSYREDKSKGRFDLFANAREKEKARGFAHLADIDFIVPCCYLADGMTVRHFGHGRYYRIAYNQSIGDHVPEGLRASTIDFADALFGVKELWAGRVFFDDARLVGQPTMLRREKSKPLMQPNPTSYQLYLKQSDQNNLNHWDDKTYLRGYKQYWHQKGDNNWRLAGGKATDSITQEMEPIASGSKFTGKIRFKNLSAVELGALLAVFDLGTGSEDICYKLGQGKSIGLGSVRIRIELRLEDTAAQYKNLFGAAGWNSTLAPSDGAEFIQKFTDYRAAKLPEETKKIERLLAELRCMLDYNNVDTPDWDKKVAMMPIGVKSDKRYQDRIILKPALRFVQESFK